MAPFVLPDWPAGTVAVLSSAGERPHAIPVSATLRAGPSRVLVALGARRESLSRIRADPRVALTVMAAGDLALTIHGSARVLAEPLFDGVVGVEIDVEQVQNHGRSSFAIDSGVGWRWRDPDAQARDGQVRAALERLARG